MRSPARCARSRPEPRETGRRRAWTSARPLRRTGGNLGGRTSAARQRAAEPPKRDRVRAARRETPNRRSRRPLLARCRPEAARVSANPVEAVAAGGRRQNRPPKPTEPTRRAPGLPAVIDARTPEPRGRVSHMARSSGGSGSTSRTLVPRVASISSCVGTRPREGCSAKSSAHSSSRISSIDVCPSPSRISRRTRCCA